MKPKLKSRIRKKTNDDWQHCCRYCHYYEVGKCWNENNFLLNEEDTSNVYEVAEEGLLSQTIEEVLNDEPIVQSFMRNVEHILDKWGISQKRIGEFEKHFRECWSEFADFDLKEKLDASISVCYQEYVDKQIRDNKNTGIDIPDPSEFSCKEWC